MFLFGLEPRGKLHKPWSAPFRVLKKLSDVTYQIQNVKRHRNRIVVHFDRLKQFIAQLNTSSVQPDRTGMPASQSQPTNHIGDNLELCDLDDDFVEQPALQTRRYPNRSHHPPA